MNQPARRITSPALLANARWDDGWPIGHGIFFAVLFDKGSQEH